MRNNINPLSKHSCPNEAQVTLFAMIPKDHNNRQIYEMQRTKHTVASLVTISLEFSASFFEQQQRQRQSGDLRQLFHQLLPEQQQDDLL